MFVVCVCDGSPSQDNIDPKLIKKLNVYMKVRLSVRRCP